MAQVLFRPQAWRDIFESAEYLERQSGLELADRFIDAVRETAQVLEKMPLIGAPCRFNRPELRDFRTLQVTGFERWLIFYQSVEEGIEIARVLHGARDLNSLSQ
jgi:toxin ParE1/3/4